MPARRRGHPVQGFGIVYLKAGWYGVPAVAGRDGGAVTVRDGGTELLCDVSDQRDVARQTGRIFERRRIEAAIGCGGDGTWRGPAQWTRAIDVYLSALR